MKNQKDKYYEETCLYCKKEFKREKTHLKTSIKRGGNAGKFCSHECSNQFHSKKIKLPCLNCGNEIQRMQWEIKKSLNVFCSHKCFILFKSKNISKIENKISCECGNKKNIQAKKCKECSLVVKTNLFFSKTKREIFEKSKNYFSARSTICKNARYWIKKYNFEKKCLICSYDKHVETAHIISVMKAPDAFQMKAINSKENLMYLCPNHHWEFDNNFISIEQILKLKQQKQTILDSHIAGE